MQEKEISDRGTGSNKWSDLILTVVFNFFNSIGKDDSLKSSTNFGLQGLRTLRSLFIKSRVL